MLSDHCLSCLTVMLVYCGPNGWMECSATILINLLTYLLMDRDATWYGGRPRPRPHCVRWETHLPPKKMHSPQFSAHNHCGQMVGWIKMLLSMEVALSPGHIVLDGDPAPLPKKGHSIPHFSADVHCGQMAAWIKMPLGTEVDLGPRNTVLEMGTKLPQRDTAPNFWHVYCGQIVAHLSYCWALFSFS